MTLSSVEFPRFGGMDLRVDPQEIGPGAAVDMRNVAVEVAGLLTTRDGMEEVAAVTSSASMFAWPTPGDSYSQLVIASDTDIAVYGPDGTLVGSTATTSAYTDFVAIGAASSTVGYLARSPAGVQKITEVGVLTSPAGMPNASFLTVQTPGNRLVAGVPGTSGGARVAFAAPGDPETWTGPTTGWVDLEPGDGDRLTALASWNNQVFAFKNNKLYVFYGNSLNVDGTPIFDWRRVSASLGAAQAVDGRSSVVVAADGVYFAHHTGIYRTTGGTPVKVSAALDPLFRARPTNPYYAGLDSFGFNFGFQDLRRVDNRLYFRADTSHWFVYDMDQDLWTYWVMPETVGPAVAAYGPASGLPGETAVADRLYVLDGTSLSRLTPTATTDKGAPFTGSYRTGFWNPGAPGSEADIFEWLIDGTGDITVKTAVNDAIALGAGRAVTLGTAPQVAQGQDRRAVWGRNISVELSGTAPWSVSRVIANVTSQTDPGFKVA